MTKDQLERRAHSLDRGEASALPNRKEAREQSRLTFFFITPSKYCSKYRKTQPFRTKSYSIGCVASIVQPSRYEERC
jgi:hypothetical protein